MTIKSIITSLVLVGSTSAAFASPAPVQDDCDPANPVAVPAASPAAWQPGTSQPGSYDPGYYRPGYRPDYARREVVLGGGRHRFDEGRKFITVGAELGRFRALKINAAAGGVFIKQVYVQFENGQNQVIRDIGARLTGNQGITLDLDGGARAIRRVVVYGSDLRFGRGNGETGYWNRRNSTFLVTGV